MTVKYISRSSNRIRWFLKNIAVGAGFIIPGVIYALLVADGMMRPLIFPIIIAIGFIIVAGLHRLIDRVLFTSAPKPFLAGVPVQELEKRPDLTAGAISRVARVSKSEEEGGPTYEVIWDNRPVAGSASTVGADATA